MLILFAMPMPSFKYKQTAVALLLGLANASAVSFTPNLQECLNLSADIEISHKAFPFGLTQKTLFIQKRYCEMAIQHRWMIKFFESHWIVDVCRTPIHIKKEWGGTQVIRRVRPCTQQTQKDTFCSEYQSIKNKIQDDGLVFAKGEKEDLVSAHGKVYCAYILLEKYLAEGEVLNRSLLPEEKSSKGP